MGTNEFSSISESSSPKRLQLHKWLDESTLLLRCLASEVRLYFKVNILSALCADRAPRLSIFDKNVQPNKFKCLIRGETGEDVGDILHDYRENLENRSHDEATVLFDNKQLVIDQYRLAVTGGLKGTEEELDTLLADSHQRIIKLFTCDKQTEFLIIGQIVDMLGVQKENEGEAIEAAFSTPEFAYCGFSSEINNCFIMYIDMDADQLYQKITTDC